MVALEDMIIRVD